MPGTPRPTLDHIVILVPHATLTAPPRWLTDAFTVLPGGTHADGATENKLILFADGVYLELIAFVPGRAGPGAQLHRWARRRAGHIVDWANTLHSDADLAAIRARLAASASPIRYDDPAPGGRTRPDGEALKWTTSAPYLVDAGAAALVGGEAPFWCLDRTPRELRVPFHTHAHVKHPSGALGVLGVSVFVSDGALFDALKAFYDALQGERGVALEGDGDGGGGSGSGSGSNAYSWSLSVLEDAAGTAPPRTLSLVRLRTDIGVSSTPQPRDVSVRLSLLSDARSEAVGGCLGDDAWDVEFDLTKV